MPVALLGALVANARAQLAGVSRKLAAARHVSHGQPADFGAVDIEADAARHLRHVGLFQARGGAMIAGEGTIIAGVDAGLEMLMGHAGLLKEGSTSPARDCSLNAQFGARLADHHAARRESQEREKRGHRDVRPYRASAEYANGGDQHEYVRDDVVPGA